ncbi:MAG: M20/M25/M40 family metallo-hydrolase [Planctomycetota bacterium]
MTSDSEMIAALERIVGLSSESGNEGDAVRAFVEIAEGWGLRGEIDGVGNGIATRPALEERRSRVVLLGHVDTVPGEIEVRLEGDVLHGRGSVDAKGPLMAMLAAASRALAPSSELVVIAAVGEETTESPGANAVVERYRPDACIIGEPSGWDGVTLGYKGRLVVHAKCVRSMAHTAGPDGSARDLLMSWWGRVLSRVVHANEDAAGAFDSVQATAHEWGDDGAWDRDGAWLRAGFRLPPRMTPEAWRELVDGESTDELELEWRGGERAHRVSRSDPVVAALSEAIRSEGARPRHKVKTGTADFNVVGPVWGCPIAAYGPGDSSLDHTPDERLSVTEFLKSVSVLERALGSLVERLGAEHASSIVT